MSLKLLRSYLAEAVRAVLVESEIYVDENGTARDDEGNVWRTRAAPGVYKASDFVRRYGAPGESHGGRQYSSQPRPPRTTLDASQVAAIGQLYARMPGNNFVASIKSQVDRGGSLSPKQKAVIVQIMRRAGMATEAALFV